MIVFVVGQHQEPFHPSHPEPASADEFGARVRAARKHQKMTLEQTARLSGISASHLSRLERGERTGLSRRVLASLASTLAVDPAPLYGAAGQLPPSIERALADPDLALAVIDGQAVPYRTRWVLRRRHLAVLAEHSFPATAAGRVDVAKHLRDRGYSIELVDAFDAQLMIEGPHVRVLRDPDDRQRLLLAHALAHAVLDQQPACLLHTQERSLEQEDREAEATALGSFILVPTTPLALAVRDESTRYDLWAEDTGAFLEALAGRFGAPAWVLARRVSEESLFVDATELEDL